MNPKLIAEIAKEHNGDVTKAQLLVDDAASGGADAVKFQVYSLADLNPKHVNYERYVKSSLGLKKIEFLKSYAAQYDMDCYVSCFSLTLLSKVAAFCTKIKVPSTFLAYEDFVKECINRYEEVHISTGMHEYEETVRLLDKYLELGIKKNVRVIPYHCVSLYPTPTCNLRLIRVKALARLFDIVGYSDHSIGNEAPLIAAHYGAQYIEKHFAFNNVKKPWCWTDKELMEFKMRLQFDSLMVDDNPLTEQEVNNKKFYSQEFKGLERCHLKLLSGGV